MYSFPCAGCGEKVSVQSFVTAAQEKCPHCGRAVILGEDPPAAAEAEETSPSPEESSPRLAKEWERRGMIAGGMIGSLGIAFIGAVGGRTGLAVVGAAGGALFGLILGTVIGLFRGIIWGIRWGDYTLLNTMTVLHVLGGLFLGMLAGSEIKELTLFILSLAMVAGLILGVVIGAVIGAALGLKAEQEGLPAEEGFVEEDGVVLRR